ncbi:MAG: glycosyltransferase [Sulfobacillus sp.]
MTDMPHKIVGFVQVYNEIRKGNLHRFLQHIRPHVHDLVAYDDGSTDGSYEELCKFMPNAHVIRGCKNEFHRELFHKQKLLELALSLSPDFILWLDVDEVLTAGADLQALGDRMSAEELDGASFKELNLWRSRTYVRMDSLYDSGNFTRFWRVTPGMRFETVEGLHHQQYPATVQRIFQYDHISVIHYGFSDYANLCAKYFTYRHSGQRGYMLYRLIHEGHALDRHITELSPELQESRLAVRRLSPEQFPEGLWTPEDHCPQVRPFVDNFASIYALRETVLKPNITFVCLIYKSVRWLQFFYDQLLRHTNLFGCEFYFVANDACPEVLDYLRFNRIPHRVHNNTEEQRREWYINNVYRAWNFGVASARGDYIVLLNSDMSFSPGWFERLFLRLRHDNCVCSRLVESGRYPSGQYGIERNFGRSHDEYREEAFLEFCRQESAPEVRDGGLFMPLLIRKTDFDAVGGYPEGNLAAGSNWRHPVYAKHGEPCISGDRVLMEKLAAIGIKHQTAFDSLVYHFQEGEMSGQSDGPQSQSAGNQMVVCNDYVTGRLGEKVLWQHLIEMSPNVVGVDMDSVVPARRCDFEAEAAKFIAHRYPESTVLLRNASFLGQIDFVGTRISYLQDNFRQLNYDTSEQLRTLDSSHHIFTNSVATAAWYPEYEMTVVPIGVDAGTFSPKDRAAMRERHGYSRSDVVGIFVGDLSPIKGWAEVLRLIRDHAEISWIVVSKNSEDALCEPNARIYHRVSQERLSELLGCANFFVVGSKSETQCLAAVEACLCDVPVLMYRTGVFFDLPEHELSEVGEVVNLSDTLAAHLPNVLAGRYRPRMVAERRGWDLFGANERWFRCLCEVQLQHDLRRVKDAPRCRTTPRGGMMGYRKDSHHGQVVREIVRNTGCESYLELGLYDGLNISQIAPLVRRSVGVDPNDGRLQYHNFVFCKQTTEEFFRNNAETFDIIFIDADHRFESVKRDFESCLRILNRGGLVLLHDTDPVGAEYLDPGRCSDCYRIVSYINETHPELDVINLPISEAGLAIVSRHSDQRHLSFVRS